MSQTKKERGIEGVYTALATPFRSGGEIDYESLGRLIERQMLHGVRGFVVAGTTGESPTLSLDEKKQLFSFVHGLCSSHQASGKKIDLMAGVGTNDTRESIELAAMAQESGYSRLLVVVPYYNKPSQAGLIKHFSAIADSTESEVILYNVPGRTGISLSTETVVELAGHARITGIKEASGDIEFLRAILAGLERKGRFLAMLSGDDATYRDFLLAGGDGVISVASHVCPTAMLEIEKAVRSGDFARADEIHQGFLPLFNDLFIEANPVPLKWFLRELGLGDGSLRLPLTEVLEANAARLMSVLRRYRVEDGKLER